MNRKLVIVLGIIVFHIAALWALQSGLLRRATEQIVSVEILSEIVKPPSPYVAPQPNQPPLPIPPPRAAAPAPVKKPIASPAPPLQTPAPQALADSSRTPVSNVAPAVAPPGLAAPPTATPIVAAPSSAASVELPSSDADYLEYPPPPPYPRISRQLGEQGTARVNVLVGADGFAQKVELEQSSGFDRLDQAAMGAALRWRYLPRKKAGVPTAKWVVVPMPFVLTD